MDFSTAVFSNRGNPFPEKIQTKGHYHPSRVSLLTPEQKHTVLSPARLHPKRDSITHLGDDSLSPADRLFLKGSQRLVAESPNSAGSSSHFDESWPSTELSSSKTPEETTQEPMPEWTAEGWRSPFSTVHDTSDLTDGPPRDESVIAKYMERFRLGRPSSREERSLPAPEERKHFWWLQSSSVKRPSPEDEMSRHADGRINSGKSLGPTTQNSSKLDVKVSSLKERNIGATQVFEIDQETIRIQERAARLLQRSESSLSSTIAVSSDGLGSSPLSCNTQSEEEATRKPFLRILSDHATGALHSLQWPKSLTPYQPALVLSTNQPEDDILYQWRLRRKMEQARDEIITGSARMKPLSPPMRLFKQTEYGFEAMVPEAALQRATNIDINQYSMPVPLSTPLLPSLASRKNPESLPVTPHLHHFCDIVPCPHQAWHLSPTRNGPEKGDRSQASAYHNDDGSRQKQSQWQSMSPQEANSEELDESSLDLTPVGHNPAECRWNCHPTSDLRHKKYSTQECPSALQKGGGHESFDSPKRVSSRHVAKGEQDSYILCQKSKVSGTKRDTVKPSSKSSDKLREAQAKTKSSYQESEINDRTRVHATTDHRTTERDQVLTRVSGPQDYHQRAKERGREVKEETGKYRAMQEEHMPKKITTHHRAMGMEHASKDEISHPLATGRMYMMKGGSTHHRAKGKEFVPEEESTSGKARERQVTTQEKTNREDAGDHQGSERHGSLAEETGKGESINKGRQMATDSPVRTILGQVISERLFSPPSSPKPIRGKSKCQPVSWKEEPSPATKDTVEPPHLKPLEVASRLLDDADESDGTEFEDDPLLQVLRERRNAILQRLRDADVIIAQLQNQTSAEGPEPK